jgi:monofunctional biosynthetic peptidoglycan transglycosylase
MSLALTPPRPVARRLLRLAGLAVLALVLLPYALMPLYAVATPPTTLMLWRWATLQPVERQVVPLDAISSILPLSVIVAEDARFCTHGGIDWANVEEAIEDHEAGKPLRGGSTITQQVVKNLFLWHGRSWLRKGLEAPLAWWAEAVLPKRRILELYLNSAEWGPAGQFGVAAGARYAFRKPPSALNGREAALLAAVLPNPVARLAADPTPRVQRLAGIYRERAQRWRDLDDCLRK